MVKKICKLGNQQPSPKKGKAHRLFREEVHPGGWKRGTSDKDEDIVTAYMKI